MTRATYIGDPASIKTLSSCHTEPVFPCIYCISYTQQSIAFTSFITITRFTSLHTFLVTTFGAQFVFHLGLHFCRSLSTLQRTLSATANLLICRQNHLRRHQQSRLVLPCSWHQVHTRLVGPLETRLILDVLRY